MKGALIGSIAAPIAGALIGGITNGVGRSCITNMIVKKINPCSLLTKGIPWTSLHEDVTIAGKHALMPDAKITCDGGADFYNKARLGYNAYVCKDVILGLLHTG
ncbi:hypothetical protein [Prevotella fusca]|uniref:hypothetical protein n=1 Tax=Prevotella fusca TaxID=589436 RepID=UPI00131F28F3|nr:hypothetical protein [Prevotella fusca]